MAKLAQGSTEYIVLIGMALIALLVAVSFLVVEPQFAYSAKKQRSDEYWANARPFAVRSYAVNQGHVILDVLNADAISLSIRGITVKGVSVGFFKISEPYNESAIPMCGGGECNMPLAPGQTAVVMTENLNVSAVLQKLCSPGGAFQEGRNYEMNLSLAYQDAGGSSEVQAGNVPLVGQCMRISINDTGT